MISDCFTDKTDYIVLDDNRYVRSLKDSTSKCEEYAENLSAILNLPKLYLFNARIKEGNLTVFNRLENWHKYNDKYYYFKPRYYESHFFNELIGQFITNYFGLESVHYTIAKIKDQNIYGIASENFCQAGFNYNTLLYTILHNKHFKCFKTDLNVVHFISEINPDPESKLLFLNDLKKIIIRNFYSTQRDANAHNVMLKTAHNITRLAPLYDYEISYNNEMPQQYQSDFCYFDITNPEVQKILKDDELFQQLLNKILEADMDSFISMVEETYHLNIPYSIKENYRNYDLKIKQLIIENKLI